MTVKVSKPAINVRSELADLRKPTGIAGEAMLRADTPAEQQALIGLGRSNLITNGAMQVAQRSTSVAGIGANATQYHTVDRWNIETGGSNSGRFTMSQSSDGPAGFGKSLKIDCTTADTSVAAGELCLLQQRIEGQDVQSFGKGTSDCTGFTVSFYCKGNASATYTLELYDSDNNRTISREFSVSSNWERVVVNFTPDTTGTFNCDNGVSLYCQIWLHAGSTWNGGTLNEHWSGVTQNKRASSNASSIFDSTDRTFFITGWQLEASNVATPFEHQSYFEELSACQRYYYAYQTINSGLGSNAFMATSYDSNSIYGVVTFPVQMRSVPSVISGGTWHARASNNVSFTANFGIQRVGRNSIAVVQGSAGTASANSAFWVESQGATGHLSFNAEL